MDVGRVNPVAGWLFPVLAGLVPVLGGVAPLALAPLIGVAALAVGWVLVAAGGRRWMPRGVPALLFALLIAYAALSALWAVDPAASLARVPRLAVIVVAGGLVVAAARDQDEAIRRRVMVALVAGLLIACLPMLADRAFGIVLGRENLFKYNRGLSLAVLLIWPASLLLLRRRARGWLALLWGVCVVTLLALESDSARLALPVGLAAAVLAWRAPRVAPALLGGLAVAYIAVAPLVHQKNALPFIRGETLEAASGAAAEPSWLPFSARHRLAIWAFAADRIAEKPLLGWGYDSARRLPGGKIVISGEAQAMPLHPHNAVLQLWVELGAGGAALAAALAVWAAVRLRRLAEPAARAAVAGYFAAAVTVLCLTFGVWQSWWLSGLFLATALFAAVLPRDG